MENNTARLIATWTLNQDPATDAPISVRWDDDSPATMDDFAKIDGGSQSYPYVTDTHVEFSYECR